MTPNLETAFMYGAAIDDNPRLADILRTQGFKRTRHAPDRLWRKGPRHGRRFVAFLNPAGDTLTVARPGRDQFTELDVNSPTLETGIHAFTH